MDKPVFSSRFRDACLTIAEHVYGPKGVWAYEAFYFIDGRYFGGRLPHPLIVWGITPHGGCIGSAAIADDRTRVPVVTLHPSLLGGTEREEPWGVRSAWLGPSLAFDVLLHECIHLHVHHNLGGPKGRSSHECERWIGQVNRIAPLLGLGQIRAEGTKPVRVPDTSRPRKLNGKHPTKVVRRSDGDVPFSTVAGFPHELRKHLGSANDHYANQRLPGGAPRLCEWRPSRGQGGTTA